MAYKLTITKKFESSAAKTSLWIQKEWSLKLALQFDKRLKNTINELILNPKTGRLSSKKILGLCV